MEGILVNEGTSEQQTCGGRGAPFGALLAFRREGGGWAEVALLKSRRMQNSRWCMIREHVYTAIDNLSNDIDIHPWPHHRSMPG